MDDRASLAERFEEHRGRLRALAYRMLGSLSEAEDAVQDAWVRLDRSGGADIENLGAWLTTVVSRLCLSMLESRRTRREEPPRRMPDPVVCLDNGASPEEDVLLGEAVGLALLVVLEELTPPERVAFVLHDVFAVPFDEIAPVVGRTPAAARQLASRGRRRVRGAGLDAGHGDGARRNVGPGSGRPDRGPGAAGTGSEAVDRRRQEEVVHAFLGAARQGDFQALLDVLDPDVVLRAEHGTGSGAAAAGGGPSLIRGARNVASGATLGAQLVRTSRVARVNGAAGIVSWAPDGRPFSVMAFTLRDGRIVAIDILADAERLERLGLPADDGRDRA